MPHLHLKAGVDTDGAPGAVSLLSAPLRPQGPGGIADISEVKLRESCMSFRQSEMHYIQST